MSRRQAELLMLLLVLFELGNNTGSVVMSRADAGGMKLLDQMRGNGDVAEFLKRDAPFPRANVADDAFAENWGAVHGGNLEAAHAPALGRGVYSGGQAHRGGATGVHGSERIARVPA